MQRCWRSAAPRWRSGRRRSRLCGVRRWSWLSPAVGLALLCAICWGTVRLPGDGLRLGDRRRWSLAVAVGRLPPGPARGRGGGAARRLAGRAASRCSPPRCRSSSRATSGSSAPASTPTCPSTCWRPTGSPTAHGSQLLHQGYPLGPHAIVVALNKGLGIGLVQGFSGLTVAVAILASLTALAAFAELPPAPRTAGALARRPRLPGRLLLRPGRLQGDDAGALRARLRPRPARGRPAAWRDLPLRFVPAALIAVGSRLHLQLPGPDLAGRPPRASGSRSSWSAGAAVEAGPARAPRRWRGRSASACSPSSSSSPPSSAG